jgi:hypothetical protein
MTAGAARYGSVHLDLRRCAVAEETVGWRCDCAGRSRVRASALIAVIVIIPFVVLMIAAVVSSVVVVRSAMRPMLVVVVIVAGEEEDVVRNAQTLLREMPDSSCRRDRQEHAESSGRGDQGKFRLHQESSHHLRSLEHGGRP